MMAELKVTKVTPTKLQPEFRYVGFVVFHERAVMLFGFLVKHGQ